MSKSIKHTKTSKPGQPIDPSDRVPTGSVLDDDSWHNFVKLGDEFLEASRFTNEGFKSAPKWPTYQAAFQALENYLKAYLLMKGATLQHVHEITGHSLPDALSEAKAKGLLLKISAAVEDAVMKVIEYYGEGAFRNSANRQWAQVSPHLVITFVDQVRRDCRL